MFSGFREYVRLSRIKDIAHRYFVLNGFDGLYTMLGIIVGSYVAGHHNPSVVLSSGFAGIIALGISGSASAYLSEKAMSEKQLKKLEESMLVSLEDSVHKDAGDFAAVFTSMVNGFSPVLTAVIMIFPFVLAQLGVMGVEAAFYFSMAIAAVEIFMLGVFLGEVTYSSRLKYGASMLVIGVFAVAVSYMVGSILG